MLPVLAAVVAVVVIAVIGWLAFTAGTDGPGDKDGGTAAGPGTGRDSSSATGGSESPSVDGAPDGVTPDGMENFIEEYLATVTSDPKAAWDLLTPDFQAVSGGFGAYNSFWKKIETADVVAARPDPAQRRISYTVEYLRRDGSKTTDDVTLVLEGTDGDYVIAAEP